MAVYNSSSDASNTAVRAFLTKVGEFYLGRSFNTGSGKGKADWERIREITFDGNCCYCGTSSAKLQIEHLVMFNRTEYGLHHPGNIAPCCKECNKRSKNDEKNYVDWKTHLEIICNQNEEPQLIQQRKNKILDHINFEQYPQLTEEEKHSIRVIANALYENIKQESERALSLYKQLDEAFVKNS